MNRPPFDQRYGNRCRSPGISPVVGGTHFSFRLHDGLSGDGALLRFSTPAGTQNGRNQCPWAINRHRCCLPENRRDATTATRYLSPRGQTNTEGLRGIRRSIWSFLLSMHCVALGCWRLSVPAGFEMIEFDVLLSIGCC